MSDEIQPVFDERFTLTGNGSFGYRFINYNNLTLGTSDIYTFESSDERFTLTGNGCLEYTFQEPMDTGANC